MFLWKEHKNVWLCPTTFSDTNSFSVAKRELPALSVYSPSHTGTRCEEHSVSTHRSLLQNSSNSHSVAMTAKSPLHNAAVIYTFLQTTPGRMCWSLSARFPLTFCGTNMILLPTNTSLEYSNAPVSNTRQRCCKRLWISSQFIYLVIFSCRLNGKMSNSCCNLFDVGL